MVTSLVPFSEQETAAVHGLCRAHRVRQLDLFGSATGPAFDPARSDLDFVVTFDELRPFDYGEAYLSLLQGLRTLFGREIDLNPERAIKNPFLRRQLETQRRPLFSQT